MDLNHKSKVPAIITVGILSSFVSIMLILFVIPVPADNRDLVIYMVGQLSGFAGASIAFWLGTTRQSEDQTRMLAQSTPIK